MLKIYSIIYYLTSLYSYTVFGYSAPDNKDFTNGCDIFQTVGYKYTHFFPVEKLPNGDIFLRFYVKAERDAHILFTSNNPQESSAPLGRIYEIGIGTYENTYSTIRMQKQGPNSVAHYEKILSNKTWLEFWIRLSVDGLIEVGKDSSKDPFMSLRDPNTAEISYYSFSCWASPDVIEYQTKHVAKYIHQCFTAKYIKYNTDKFKYSLLSKYDQHIPPKEAANDVIQINISNSYADWNDINGILKLIGHANVTWHDSRLSWEPTQYYGVTSLDLSSDPIWRPVINVTNAAFDNDKPFASGETRVSHEGVVSWSVPHFSLHIKCNYTISSKDQGCPFNLTINTLQSRVHVNDINQCEVSSSWGGIINSKVITTKKINDKSSSHSILIKPPL